MGRSRALLAAGACAVLGGLVVLLLASRDRSARAELSPGDRAVRSETQASPQTAPAALAGSEDAPRLDSGADAASREVVSSPGPKASPSSPLSVIQGRVVDEDGRPIEGASVTFRSVDGPWTAVGDSPVFVENGHRLEGLTQETGSDGVFRFDAPMPTSSWVSMLVDAGPFFGLNGREFGPAGGRDQPRLVRGMNDLGDVALATTGAVRGRVRSASGGDVDDARIRLEGSFAGGRTVSTQVADDGSFELGHVPPGTWTLSAKAEGWLTAKVSGVEVASRAFTQGVELALARAPTISGVVVDERGEPLEGIAVRGWPRHGGQGARATSDASGRFTMQLPQDEPYSLGVDASGFEPWGGHQIGAGAAVEPGKDDVRIVLKRVAETTFAVIDAQTLEPVTRFGIGIGRKADQLDLHLSTDWTSPEVGNEIALPATPGEHVVYVRAPGYAPLEEEVGHDDGTSARQTLRLRRGGSLVARIVSQGEPLAQASVRLERDHLGKEDRASPLTKELAELGYVEDDELTSSGAFDLGAFAGREQTFEADGEGKVRIQDLAPGTYRLTASAPGVAPRTVREVRIEAAVEKDLGEIALEAGAAVRGRVVLAEGSSPVGLELSLEDGTRDTRIESADGAFAIDGLAAGKHVIVLMPAPPLVLERMAVPFEVAAGETREVVIDASATAPCRVRVRVMRGGRPATGIAVQVVVGDEQRFYSSQNFGVTDSEGIASGVARSGELLRFDALAKNRLRIGSSEIATLMPGGDHETSIEIASGELVLVFPSSLEIPETGAFVLSFHPKGDTDTGVQLVQWHTKSVPFDFPGGSAWTDRRCEIGPVAPGEYLVRVRATKLKDADGDGRRWTNEDIGQPYQGELVIRDGETSVLELP